MSKDILERAHETYQERSDAASSLCRQLCFAGIALIWVFRIESAGARTLDAELVWPALGIVLALSLDLLQYVGASIIFSSWHRIWEKRVADGNPPPLDWPAWFNYPAIMCFYGKVVLTGIAYVLIISFLVSKVLPGPESSNGGP